MRRPMMAGNWKMNLTAETGAALALRVAESAVSHSGVEVVVAPPFTELQAVATALRGSEVAVAAQDMHWAASGPYTGAVSPVMAREFATRVILGHSERRRLFCETDADVCRKTHAAFDHGLLPIVCVGETEEERDEGVADEVVKRQLAAACEGLRPREAASLVVAYEPVWAIGTGRSCPPDEAGRVAGLLRAHLARLFDDVVAAAARILYGGSMAPGNAAELLLETEIDGGLVGGASLHAGAFGPLVQAAGTAA